jgi:hypothetical protein
MVKINFLIIKSKYNLNITKVESYFRTDIVLFILYALKFTINLTKSRWILYNL